MALELRALCDKTLAERAEPCLGEWSSLSGHWARDGSSG